MKRYNDLSTWLKNRFGSKVYKVSLTASTTCPNIDGALATGGCSFCNNASYAPLSSGRRNQPISLQLKEGMDYVRRRHKTSKFIAYFQSFTSTYGDKRDLLLKFRESLEPPDVVGLALSTRPDCIDIEWARELSKLARGKLFWIEIGLQTANDRTLNRINRWHTRWQFGEALKILKYHGNFPVCAHAILGLPGEGREAMIDTAKYLATQPIQGVKIHNLHVVKGTPLAKKYEKGDYKPFSLKKYVQMCVDFLEYTPTNVLIHRLNAHAPKGLTLAPDWSVNKLAIFNAVEEELKRRDSWQGKTLGFERKV